jgi:hypothetical protein
MIQGIFRKTALERLASPEQLDQLLQVTSPRGWLALTGLGLLVATALIWSFFGTVTTTVEGQGILIRPEGVTSVVAPQVGVVRSVLVRVGDVIYKDREVVRLAVPEAAGGSQLVLSSHSGRVMEIQVREGSTVERGAPLLLLEGVDQRLQALIYVPSAEGQRVQSGMRVELAPGSVKWSEFGYVLGQVDEAAKFASSRQGMMTHLENEEIVHSLTRDGPCVQVLADLVPAPDTPSGYQWSSSKGPPVRLHHGTPCRARITVRVQRPISLVIPTVRDLLGF